MFVMQKKMFVMRQVWKRCAIGKWLSNALPRTRRVPALALTSGMLTSTLCANCDAHLWWPWSKKPPSPEEQRALHRRQEFEVGAEKEFHTAAHNPLPDGWTGKVFVPNFNFPAVHDPKWHDDANCPWRKFDYDTQPKEYLQAVLDYCFEGNIVPNNVQNSFDVSRSKKWFHMPFQHMGPSGREPISGLTQERPSSAGWLSDVQSKTAQTLAVGMYNSAGAYTIGQVWKDKSAPNFKGPEGKGVKFLDDTVTFKLLFTTCDVDEAPYLKNAPTWDAMKQSYPGTSASDPDPPRVLTKVRLLQIDVAVRDPRAAKESGWVFGTFIFDSSVPADSPWKKLVPVGLESSSHPDRTLADREKPLTHGWLNPAAKDRIITKVRPMIGFANRICGPADNYRSSCVQCHSAAQFPSVKELVVNAPACPHDGTPLDPLVYDIGNSEYKYFFRNVPGGEVFSQNMSFYGPVTKQNVFGLDYSLQLQNALNNFFVWANAAFPDVMRPAIESCKVPGNKMHKMHPHKVSEAKSVSGDIDARHTRRH